LSPSNTGFFNKIKNIVHPNAKVATQTASLKKLFGSSGRYSEMDNLYTKGLSGQKPAPRGRDPNPISNEMWV
jgi:hypothetical protein